VTVEGAIETQLLFPAGEAYTTQALELRLAEGAALTNNILRFSRAAGFGEHESAHRTNKSMCIRSFAPGSSFLVKASRSTEDGYWRVKTADIGQIIDSGTNKANKNSSVPYTTHQLMNLFLPDIAMAHKLAHKTMLDKLAPYVSNVDSITHTRTTRIEEAGREHLWGSPKEAIQQATGWVAENRRSGHHAQVAVTTEEHMLTMLLVKVRADHEREQKERQDEDKTYKRVDFDKKAWWKANKTKLKEMHGLGLDQNKRNPRLFPVRFFWSPGTLAFRGTDGVQLNNLIEVFEMDAAHCDWGAWTLYSMCGHIGTMQNTVVAHALQYGNEDKAGWNWFMHELLTAHPGLDVKEHTVITDGQKGLLDGLAKLLFASGFRCTHHRSDNVRKQCNQEAKRLFAAAVKARTPEQLTAAKAKYAGLSHKARGYLAAMEDEETYPAARAAAAFRLYGKEASTGVEGMNGANKEAVRGSSVPNALCGLHQLVVEEQRRYNDMKRTSESRMVPLVKEAQDRFLRYDELIADGGRWVVTHQHGNKYKVQRLNVSFEVQMQTVVNPQNSELWATSTCTCGEPLHSTFPCLHMWAVAKGVGHTMLALAPPWAFNNVVRSATSSVFNCPTWEAIMDRKHNNPDFYSPFGAPRKTGRPKKRSRVVVFKTKRRKYCTKCHGVHGRRKPCLEPATLGV
jgi:hypothetical protein